MSDDPGGATLASIYYGGPASQPNVLSANPAQALAQGLGYYDTGAQTSPIASTYLNKLQNAYAAGQLTPGQPIGPGGRDPKTGLPYAWLPYDPNQSISDPHMHFGPTYNDPILGQLQSTYTEPSKSANDIWHNLGPLVAGAAVSAISGGAGTPWLAPLFSGAMQYGTTGRINPAQLAISSAGALLPGVLQSGGIDPALASAYKIGSSALGVGNAALQASRGNYNPAANIGINQTLAQLLAMGRGA